MQTSREEQLRSLFDTSGFGLEIGPSYNPLLPKADGYRVETVDHAGANDLRAKYATLPGAAERIEDVDYVTDGRPMLDVIGQVDRYDFIFASHVIEHVPNIVGFFVECQKLLKPDGALVLAVPDKRYCFDLFRPVSTLGQAVEAHLQGHTRHSIASLFDHVAYFTMKDGGYVWVKPGTAPVTFAHTLDDGLTLAKRAQASDEYFDAHGWRFTPSSFRFMADALAELGLIDLVIVEERQYDGPVFKHEFYVVMRKSGAAVAQPVDREAALNEIRKDLLEVMNPDEPPPPAWVGQLGGREAELLNLVEAMRRSNSWKITAPLRWIVNLWRGSLGMRGGMG